MIKAHIASHLVLHSSHRQKAAINHVLEEEDHRVPMAPRVVSWPAENTVVVHILR